jgi:hypothetical protein
MLLQDKIELMKKGLESLNLNEEESIEKIQEALTNKNSKILEEQVPFWELTIALCLLCWLILIEKDAILL